jgi:hypothetical protein
MKPAFIKEMVHDFAEALRVNPLAGRDVRSCWKHWTQAGFILGYPEADPRELAGICAEFRMKHPPA